MFGVVSCSHCRRRLPNFPSSRIGERKCVYRSCIDIADVRIVAHFSSANENRRRGTFFGHEELGKSIALTLAQKFSKKLSLVTYMPKLVILSVVEE